MASDRDSTQSLMESLSCKSFRRKFWVLSRRAEGSPPLAATMIKVPCDTPLLAARSFIRRREAMEKCGSREKPYKTGIWENSIARGEWLSEYSWGRQLQ
jgi:hypothetical protein